ncbi:hypothetical protein E2542_SST12582 [Spatholobus suberectus]|nr:hypothetical protein E2542_SST12582 [Spatholobus suberectus]
MQQQGKPDLRDSEVVLLLLNSNPLTSVVLFFKETVHIKRETKFLVQTKGKSTQVLILYTTDKLPEETSTIFRVLNPSFLNFPLLFFFFSFLSLYYYILKAFFVLYKSFPVSSQMYMKILRFEIILVMMREYS